jgi:Holliday junction resolvase RusA-like endonuclease
MSPLTFELPLCPSWNNATPTSGNFRPLSTVAREWKRNAVLRLRLLREPMRTQPVALFFRFWFPTMAGDLTNRIKLTEDVLVEAGLIKDDSVRHVRELRQEFAGIDRGNPRVEVTITELWTPVETPEDDAAEFVRTRVKPATVAVKTADRKTLAVLATSATYKGRKP